MSTLNATDLESFTLDFNDREIYNDIRAECDITEILTIRPDATPEFFDTFKVGAWAEPIPKNSTLDITATADSDHTEVVWLDIISYSFGPETILGWGQGACEQLGGKWRDLGSTTMCRLPSSLVESDVSWNIIRRSGNTCTIRVINDSDYDVRGVWYISYLAVTPETRYIKIRSTDEISIAKYGRRVMDLIWPLGQHPNTMQAMVDTYCERYSEPVCIASMTLVGENDTWLQYILTFAIDDRHTIVHPRLNLNEEFFINSIRASYQKGGDGLLRNTFDLEQVRDMEQSQIFTLDTSVLSPAVAPNTDDVLG